MLLANDELSLPYTTTNFVPKLELGNENVA